MAETEVESILREIRERVMAQQQAAKISPPPTTVGRVNGNGAGEIQTKAPRNEVVAENLALINSYLTTTARAWDRLPPLVSNRSGLSARIELWVKKHLKRATRWYAWEQVNFNAAVHHALRDLLPILSAYEQEIQRLQIQIATGEARRQELESRLQQQSNENAERIGELRSYVDADVSELKALKNQTEQRFETTEAALRERTAAIEDELRVCFKQVSLETSEAAVLEDRVRRKTELMLEEIKRRLEIK
jgi:hypothetical protein